MDNKRVIFSPSFKACLSLGLAAAFFVGAESLAAVPDKGAGMIKIDGSSTVFPISEAAVEEFGKINSAVKITVGESGTGGGFKKFCASETEISDASRPIKATEQETCKANGIEYIELPVAYDALTVVVNPKNTWAESMTVKELKMLWAPEAQGKITKWNQIRASWPDKPIRLFGPGVDSGTFDYFTEAIVGKEDSSRGDYTASEDDNVLVQGVANDVNALGYFGQAYYNQNQGKLKAILIDDENDANGKGAQAPTVANVVNGTYVPLARPLFIYVRLDAIARPEVKEFVSFYLKEGAALAKEVGYVALPSRVTELATNRFNKKILGSALAGKSTQVGLNLETLLSEQH